MGVSGHQLYDPKNRAEYSRYISSAAWAQKKDKYRKSKLPQECYCCGEHRGPKQFHHRSYRNFGRERLMDIVPVCQGCHDEVHRYQRQRQCDIWQATTRTRKKRRFFEAERAVQVAGKGNAERKARALTDAQQLRASEQKKLRKRQEAAKGKA